jgi:predicted acyl esterase
MKYPVYDQVETAYPIPRTKYIKLFLTGQSTLSPTPIAAPETVQSYNATAKNPGAHFDYVFHERTTIAGFSKIRLFMSCPDHNDLDIYVMLRKLSVDGELMEQSNVPLHELPPEIKTAKQVYNVTTCKYLGPTGMLRASHRKTDPEKSTEYWPWHPHQSAELVPKGGIVELEIGIWPCGIVFEKGEGLRVHLSGRDMRLPEWDNPHVANMEPVFNKGSHNVHLGGKYKESYLLIPKI